MICFVMVIKRLPACRLLSGFGSKSFSHCFSLFSEAIQVAYSNPERLSRKRVARRVQSGSLGGRCRSGGPRRVGQL